MKKVTWAVDTRKIHNVTSKGLVMTSMNMPPKILYKYFSSERSAFFLSPMLRFSPLTDLNDPFECMPTFSDIPMNEDRCETIKNEQILKSQLESGKYNGIIPDKDISSMLNSTMVDENFETQAKRSSLFLEKHKVFFKKNPVGILSLTSANNNILMWSHYANDHKGFVVGFDTGHSFFKDARSLNPLIGRLLEVQYSERRYNKIDDFVQNVLKSNDSDKIFEELDHDDEYYVDNVVNKISNEIITKSFLWKYEKEWRYAVNNVDSVNSLGIIGLVEIAPEMIKSVYLGMFSSQFQNYLAFKFKQKYPSVVLKKARMHETEYKLRFDNFNMCS